MQAGDFRSLVWVLYDFENSGEFSFILLWVLQNSSE